MAFNQGGSDALKVAAQILSQVINESARGLPAEQVLQIAGVELVNEIKLELSNAGSGRVYQRGGVQHQASAPGEPPAVDTGRLRNSVAMDVGSDEGGPYVEVGTNVEYAPYLEFGTSVMDPRPFMQPAVVRATPKMAEVIAAGIERAQRAAIAGMPRQIEL